MLLPDGSSVVAVSFDPNGPYTREQGPDFGLYLDHRWSPPWAHDHVEWPDFGVPTSSADLQSELARLLERSRRGEHVEEPPGRGSNRSNLPLIPSGGSQLMSASGSTKAA